MATEKTLFDDEFVRKIEYLYLLSKKIFGARRRAEHKTKKTASGVEFADHRNYAPGDDFRFIDWRVFARTEKLLLKLFEEKQELNILFLPDISASMAFGSKLDYAKKMTAALAYIGLCNQNRVSILPFDAKAATRLPPCTGRGQIHKIFHYLDRLEASGETDMVQSFGSLALGSGKNMAVVISDFYNPEGFEAALNFLRYRRIETYVVQIFDNDEALLSLAGDAELIDSESREGLRLTINASLLQSYRKEQQLYAREIEAFCSTRDMLYMRADVQIPFDDVILKIFRAGGFIS